MGADLPLLPGQAGDPGRAGRRGHHGVPGAAQAAGPGTDAAGRPARAGRYRVVEAIRANLDLVTILISERQALAGDTRFVQFVDEAATRLGRLIDAETGAGDDRQGYLTARAYFGALIAFVLLQDQLGLSSIRQVDAAGYIHHLAQVTVRGIS